MQKNHIGLFLVAFMLGFLLSASGCYYIYTRIIADSEAKSSSIIGQLESEQRLATEIVGGLADRIGKIKDTGERQRQIIEGLRTLVKLYFPDK